MTGDVNVNSKINEQAMENNQSASRPKPERRMGAGAAGTFAKSRSKFGARRRKSKTPPPPAGWHNRRRGGRRKNLRKMRGIHPNNLRDWSIGEHRHATALGVLYPIHRPQDDPRVRVRKKFQIPAN